MQNEALRTLSVYRPFNKKIFYKDSSLRVYRQQPSLKNSLVKSNHERHSYSFIQFSSLGMLFVVPLVETLV